MIAPLLLALLQAPAAAAPAPSPPAAPRGPTVGDTIWLARTVPVPAGRAVRAPEWNPEGDVELLGRARIVVRGDSAEVRYPAVAWKPGPQTVTVPGPLLLAADGSVDSFPAATFTVTVASVLPAVPADSALAPQPPTAIVPRGTRSAAPLIVLLVAVATVGVLAWVWWRRRRKPVTVPAVVAGPPAMPYGAWNEAGERRAVASAAATRLRAWLAGAVPAAHPALDTEAALRQVAEARPTWPHDELAALLRALDEARFAPASRPDAARLAEAAEALPARLAAVERSPSESPAASSSAGAA